MAEGCFRFLVFPAQARDFSAQPEQVV
jgi:hypothetical protein